MQWHQYLLLSLAVGLVGRRVFVRLRLSKAKHPSLRGHSKIARRLAKLLPFYEYGTERIFSVDGAPAEVIERRRVAFFRLADRSKENGPKSILFTEALAESVSDLQFINAYRVPFQFRNYVGLHLSPGAVVTRSRGAQVEDLDGKWCYDVFGSYGVNVFGYEFYKECIDEGWSRVRELGPVLGPYHPLVAENAAKLVEISGLDEVSFHMSGTEAVMQAVRLARYHTGRPRIVRFCGAYHGWWDGVQPGVGNERVVNDVYTLKDMSEDTLAVLRTRRDIACVLVNPLQAMHPNSNPPADGSLITNGFHADFDREAYTKWLQELRSVCDKRGIVLLFDEVFLGFRLARGGAQEYFGVRADMVTYGKTLGGGLPVGVVCGRAQLMKRFREGRPAHVCLARGTFNAHPLVMSTMNAFLRRSEEPAHALDYEALDRLWNKRLAFLNKRLETAGLTVRLANLSSIWTVLYTQPGRYHWMLQFYLRDEGLALSWIGSARLIFPHNLSDSEFDEIASRFVRAAEAMNADGWWWTHPGLTNKTIKRSILRETLRLVWKQ